MAAAPGPSRTRVDCQCPEQGGDTDPLFFISLIVRWRPSRKAGARGPARPIPTWNPRVDRLSYMSCDSPRKRGLVASPLLPLPAPAFRR